MVIFVIDRAVLVDGEAVVNLVFGISRRGRDFMEIIGCVGFQVLSVLIGGQLDVNIAVFSVLRAGSEHHVIAFVILNGECFGRIVFIIQQIPLFIRLGLQQRKSGSVQSFFHMTGTVLEQHKGGILRRSMGTGTDLRTLRDTGTVTEHRDIVAEGNGAVTEETLVLGVVNLVPKSIKKWISVSDEALDLRGEAFLRYIYDELTYQIAKKAADELIAQIKACGTVSTTTQVGVPVVASTTVGVGLVAQAMAKLSDEAANPVVMMNKATWGAFKAAQYANGFDADPFEGLPVVFNNTIAAFSAATTGVPYAIVGDLEQGALMNFPNGEGIDFKVDELSQAEYDLVRIIGREFVGIGVVAPDAFVKITK